MEQKFFTVVGVSRSLEHIQEKSRKLLTLEQIETIMEHNDRAIIPISGDCMEAAGVMNNGWVAVDFTRFPAPPRYKSRGGDGREDACMCYAVYPGQRTPTVMCKACTGVWGSWQMVGTCYDLSKGKHRMNCGMEAQRIFGVIFASWDAEGRLLWQRDPSSFPDHLGTAPTFHGGNISELIPLPKKAAV